MPCIEFIPKKFTAAHRAVIDKANDILEENNEQGYTLTLRQLYYQFISQDFFPNSTQSYKRLGTIISDARMAGEINWSYMTDRTRTLRGVSTWESTSEILEYVAEQYIIDKWETQEIRPEVWVEKEALIEVVSKACAGWQVDHFACKGYTSQSSMFDASRRFMSRFGHQTTHVIYLGDHDPSGIDMTRDIQERLKILTQNVGLVYVSRIALNMSQIEVFTPPPNPTKFTDSRAKRYVAEYGADSWELDALKPQYLHEIIQTAIKSEINFEFWNNAVAEEKAGRKVLKKYADMEKG